MIVSLAKSTYGNHYAIVFPLVSLFCLLGVLTNILNIVVFTRHQMRTPPNLLLLYLSIADLALILTQIPHHIHELMDFRSIFTYNWNQLDITLIFLENAFSINVQWLSVAIGAWRFFAVRYPLRALGTITNFKAKTIGVSICAASLLLSLPIYFLIECCQEEYIFEKYLYLKQFTDVARDHNGFFLNFYHSILPFFDVIPLVFIFLLTIMLVYILLSTKKERTRLFGTSERPSRTNHRTTYMLLILLLLTLLNGIPDCALTIAKILDLNRDSVKEVTDVLRIFTMLNSSVTFLLYYFMGENFRNTFKFIWRKVRYSSRAFEDKKFSLNMSSTDTVWNSTSSENKRKRNTRNSVLEGKKTDVTNVE